METFVYVATSEGGPRGNTDAICQMLAKSGASSDASDKERLDTPDINVRSIDSLAFIGEEDTVDPRFDGVLYLDVDLSSEDVLIFKSDVETILSRDFDSRERMALLIYGTMGASHAINYLSEKIGYYDLMAYFGQWHDTEAPNKAGPWIRMKFYQILESFENMMIEPGYLSQTRRDRKEAQAA